MVADEIAKVVRQANQNGSMSVEDMKGMAYMFKIVKNYLKMKKLEGRSWEG